MHAGRAARDAQTRPVLAWSDQVGWGGRSDPARPFVGKWALMILWLWGAEDVTGLVSFSNLAVRVPS
jgi:hypothetical protein